MDQVNMNEQTFKHKSKWFGLDGHTNTTWNLGFVFSFSYKYRHIAICLNKSTWSCEH